MLATGSNTIKLSPTTLAMKKQGKAMIMVRNGNIGNFGTQEKVLKVFADHCRTRPNKNPKKLMEEKIQSDFNEFSRKIKADKKVKLKRCHPGSGFSASKSNNARAMRVCIPKLPKFSAFTNQDVETNIALPIQFIITTTNSPSTALQHFSPATSNTTADKRTSGRTKQNPIFMVRKIQPRTLYSLFRSNFNAKLVTHRKFPTPDISVFETVRSTAEQAPEE